ncbi:adenosylcobinamide kinase/adenosylcobinamide phosphate guanyltransferase [Paenibacillus sp. J31TS4]|uniref:bifunctional adenosylcobinamide kinase/adenosylcobinamide-phosphate guanylyltransferase n=1 Tax=Paenibacillus sp. J31TS4 TaxID=2807195 RepID=UPI001B21896D|nr:bifunctional adenosylcobinamide kinase/adenosylcobinamide-phosphate guanylyltransferase [Paenibacillus sp. J31TS4]GIP38782.1 adenosylcobinamide kinase/adenosylcobinamide phosphate guanyltransferase [Paenibacillus sp. J31TS4]
MIVLVTGGARSGKSGFAERYAAKLARTGCYVATSEVYDEEMRERVELHKRQREASGFGWTTREEPVELALLLREAEERRLKRQRAGAPADEEPAWLVDCLTLWLSNRLLRAEALSPAEQEAELSRAIDELVASVEGFGGTLLLVTNEVGSGIVPAYPLGRRYRDWAGRLNQRIAAVSDQVILVTSGIAVDLKRLEFRL